jgi:hypothetical protein
MSPVLTKRTEKVLLALNWLVDVVLINVTGTVYIVPTFVTMPVIE